ncbi:putative minor capsid protein [Listeria newyorkensis]|uniref:Minor capsid protein n=1 Tax=Listeria newyorkensis TaxID=1497681 RepID=A0A841Z076_9LIST|nr:putative minor capsid protein [Listeria newyorkensis]MBC1459070.1 minor capsid protein [Listeria newyorkensis]
MIQRRLLIHDIEYKRYNSQGAYGESWDDAITINRVRVQAVNRVVKSATGDDIQSNTLIFIDRIVSSPALRPDEKSIIIFDNREYHVVAVDDVYARGSNVHHWEVYCN